jgi:excisionase family DNA binding protein
MSATDDLIRRAFAETVLITAEKAAQILGLDDRTFKALADAGAIRSVRIGTRGTTRRYTEDDLRAFLSRETEMPEAQCRSTNPRKARTGNMISSTKAVDIAVLLAQRRARRRSGSNKQSA